MTKFTWLNGYRDTIHICNCDDISATAEIDTINGITTFYNKYHQPLGQLMSNLSRYKEIGLIEAKKECEEYLSRIHLDFNLKDIEMSENYINCDYPAIGGGVTDACRGEETKHNLQDLIITKDDLQQLKVLDKPTDTATRLVWIFRTVAYEYSRGKKGCRIPLNEICINGLSLRKQGDKERYKFEKDISKPLEQAGYTVNMIFNMELIGDCLEIVWG